MVNLLGSRSDFTCVQANSIDTVAPGRARVDNGAMAVASNHQVARASMLGVGHLDISHLAKRYAKTSMPAVSPIPDPPTRPRQAFWPPT